MFDIFRFGLNITTIIYSIAFLVAILFSISAHEYAHGYIANKQGDATAKYYDRLTLNPFAHFDVLGFLSLLLFGFGWAKPVPINPLKFREYKKGIFLTSIAGIVTNIFLAFFCSGIFVLLCKIEVANTSFLFYILLLITYIFYFCAIVNINLAVFNCLPIAPLDGFNILVSMTNGNNKFVDFMFKYGSIILILVIAISSVANVLGLVGGSISNIFINFWKWVL